MNGRSLLRVERRDRDKRARFLDNGTRRTFVAIAGLAALFATSLARAAIPTVALGRVIELPVYSSVVASRSVAVWLPDGYDQNPWAYPVLYMPDAPSLFAVAAGASVGDAGIDEHIVGLAFAGEIRTPIVVAIGRSPQHAREYAPAAPVALLPAALRAEAVARLGGMPLSDAYLRFVTAELKPLVDRTFRTLPGAADTAILGRGAAGYVALYALMRFPHVFGNAGCLSDRTPVFDPGSSAPHAALADVAARYFETALPRAGSHRLYLDFDNLAGDPAVTALQRACTNAARAKGYVEGLDLVSALRTVASDNPWRDNDQTDIALTLLLKSRCPPMRQGRSD